MNNGILKLNFFSINSLEKSNVKRSKKTNVYTLNDIGNINVMNMWIVKRKIYILCKTYGNNKEKSLEYLILKIEEGLIVEYYQIFNRNIYCGNLVKHKRNQSNIFSENYYLVLAGSDFFINLNMQEQKKDPNILTYIVIIDLNSMEVNANNDTLNKNVNSFKCLQRDILPYIVKRINLVTIPNSIFYNTDEVLPNSFESLSGIFCMDISDDLSMIALGLENGKAILIFPSENNLLIPSLVKQFKETEIDKNKSNLGDLSFLSKSFIATNKSNKDSNKDNKKSSVYLNLLSNTKIVAIELNDMKEKFSINSIKFSNLGKSKKGDYSVLYIATLNNIYYYSIEKNSGKIGFYILNSNIGTMLNSIILSEIPGQVYFNTKENYISEYLNFSKKSVYMFGKITNCIFFNKKYFCFSLYESSSPIICVYDIKNKIFAYTNNMFTDILIISNDVFDDEIYFLAETQQSTYQIYYLKEKENSKKFDLMYKNNLYQLAIEYAENSRMSQSCVDEVYKNYGDYLYKNGEYSKAISEYCKTIMTVHPSHIIEKFIMNNKIEFLLSYLEYLHYDDNFRNKFASEMMNYSKLLINIYSKLKKVIKLNTFIEKINFDSLDSNDIELLISSCLEQNQEIIAFKIASKTKLTVNIISILIESKSKLF